MIDACFRRPADGEIVRPLLIDEILTEILVEFPSMKATEGIHVRIGKVLKAQNFERKRITQGSAYYIVSRKASA